MDNQDDPYTNADTSSENGSGNWWDGPRPSYWPPNQPWPPALSPGDSYGQAVGSVVKAQGTQNSIFDAGANVVPGVDIPLSGQKSSGGNGSIGGSSGGGYYGGPSDQFAPIMMSPFQAPAPQSIGNAPDYKTPPPFSFGEFKAPSYADAMNDPGGKFAITQGEDALSRFYAANGQGDSSTAYKGLIDYGRTAANTLYGDIFNRDLTGYQANRANAVDTYNTNYQTQYKDAYAPQLQSWQTNAQNTQFNNSTANTNAWNSYLQDYLQKHNNQLDSWNRLFQTTSLQ